MAEIFGIVSAGPLSPDDRAVFARLAAAFAVGSVPVRTLERASALLGVASHHAGDRAALGADARSGRAAVFVGGLAEGGSGRAEPARLPAALGEQGPPSPGDVPPPYAACVVEGDLPAAWLLSDRYGLQPLHWTEHAGRLAFASRVGPLVRAGLGPWQLDPVAVLDLLTFEHATGDRTLVDSVRVLGPGCLLRFADGRVRERRWAPLPAPAAGAGLASGALAALLHESLRASVSRSLSAGARTAITLSGGLDSRALLGCAAGQGASLRAYTFGVPGSRDVTYASRLAARVGVPHRAIEITPDFLPRWLDHAVETTGGAVGAVHFHILSLADVLASETDRVLDGLGGDALSGAHLGWSLFLARSPAAAAENVYRQRATAFASPGARAALLEPAWLAATEWDPREATRRHARADGAPAWWAAHRFDLLERQRRFIQFGPHLLRPFVDVRTPFYDPAVAELLWHARATALFEQRAYRRMHARWLGTLADVPDAGRRLPLSASTPRRMARRVVDAARRRLPRGLQGGPDGRSPTAYAEWLRGPLRGFAREQLLDGHGVAAGVVRRAAVERLLAEHTSGAADHTPRLGVLLSLFGFLRSLGSRPA